MPSILIIDDDDLVREAMRTLLCAKGYEVVAVEDGEAGIEASRTNHFDLAIVDLFMPGTNGLKVMQSIRQSNPALPMIAASGFMFRGGDCPPMPGFETMAVEAGAVSTLYKPFRPNEVLKAVEQAIHASH
jgi:CheY-like chemotaxis protein